MPVGDFVQFVKRNVIERGDSLGGGDADAAVGGGVHSCIRRCGGGGLAGVVDGGGSGGCRSVCGVGVDLGGFGILLVFLMVLVVGWCGRRDRRL